MAAITNRDCHHLQQTELHSSERIDDQRFSSESRSSPLAAGDKCRSGIRPDTHQMPPYEPSTATRHRLLIEQAINLLILDHHRTLTNDDMTEQAEYAFAFQHRVCSVVDPC